MPFKSTVSAVALTALAAGTAAARDNIQIAGYSTVLPHAAIVVEAFGENTIGNANSSSRIKQCDIDLSASNGMTEIMEVRIGYDGIVSASDINGPAYAFSPADWHAAPAAQVVKDGALADNTDKPRVATMGGVVPAVEPIASGEYPVSRPLLFYVKNAHLDMIPGMQHHIEVYVSDPELAKTRDMVANRVPMGVLT